MTDYEKIRCKAEEHMRQFTKYAPNLLHDVDKNTLIALMCDMARFGAEQERAKQKEAPMEPSKKDVELAEDLIADAKLVVGSRFPLMWKIAKALAEARQEGPSAPITDWSQLDADIVRAIRKGLCWTGSIRSAVYWQGKTPSLSLIEERLSRLREAGLVKFVPAQAARGWVLT